MLHYDVPNKWKPRRYQFPAWQHFQGDASNKRGIIVAHRRWGKDDLFLNLAAVQAWERVGNYWLVFPHYTQGRKAIWKNVDANTGQSRINRTFPRGWRKSTNDQQMFIELKNGSTFQVVGSDNIDSLVGAGPVGVGLSEYALQNPAAWAYIRPMVVENNGWMLANTTPRGNNHARRMFDAAMSNPKWYAELSNVHQTGALTEDQIIEAKQEYISNYGEDHGRALFEQEYECSFQAAVLGAYYAVELKEVYQGRQVRNVIPFPDRPIHTAWDLGVRDDTAIIWFQVFNNKPYILDAYSAPGGDAEIYAEIAKRRCEELGGVHGFAYLPHDAKAREWGGGRTRVEIVRRLGLKVRVVPNHTLQDGIQASRHTLRVAVFDHACKHRLFPALEGYRRDWNEKQMQFDAKPVHDWTSHLADAFRYLSMSWRDLPVSRDQLATDFRSNHQPLPHATDMIDEEGARLLNGELPRGNPSQYT